MATKTEAIRDTLAAQRAKQMVRKTFRDSTKQDPSEVVNTRVWNMFREAVDFKADAITPFQRSMADLEAATLSLFEGVLPLLRAPLPRVWDTVEGGLAEPIRATVSHNHPNITGGEMDDAAIRASATEYEAKLQLKVRRPLAQWSDALETVRERIPELERLRNRLQKRIKKVERSELRAEKDARKSIGIKRGSTTARPLSSRRRGKNMGGIRGAFYKCTHPRADDFELDPAYDMGTGTGDVRGSGGRMAGDMSPHGGVGSPGGRVGGVDNTLGSGTGVSDVRDTTVAREFKKEERAMQIKDRQRKLEVAREAFSAEETLLYEQLAGLCRDSVWAKSYIASALIMTKELYQETVFNLGETLQPLPAYKSITSPAGGVETGGRSLAGSGYNTPRKGPAVEGGFQSVGGMEGITIPGQLGSNMMYNESMPEYATRDRAAHFLEELQSLADRRSRTNRVTAAPLELHATLDARGAADRYGDRLRFAPSLAPPPLAASGHSGHTSGMATPTAAGGAMSGGALMRELNRGGGAGGAGALGAGAMAPGVDSSRVMPATRSQVVQPQTPPTSRIPSTMTSHQPQGPTTTTVYPSNTTMTTTVTPGRVMDGTSERISAEGSRLPPALGAMRE